MGLTEEKRLKTTAQIAESGALMIAVMNGDALGIAKTATTVSVSFSILHRVLVSTTLALWVLRTPFQMT